MQLDVASRGPRHVLDRRDPAQHLLDRRRQSARILTQPLELVRIAQELGHAAAYDMPGRLVPTDQDQQGLVDQRVLVEPVPFDLGMNEGPDEIVVLAAAPSLLDDPGYVVDVLDESRSRTVRSRSGSGDP